MDAVAEAQLLYQDALDASMRQREQITEDLEFSDPSDPQQWDADVKRQRENDPGGARPCLVFDQLGQYVANVAGQVEQRPPSLHALPVDGGADRKVAEQLDGFFRHIEHTSRAAQHYTRALTSAARTGVGYLILRPTVINPALNWQEPRISSEGDPLNVVLDPWSVELDGSDANFGFLLTPLSHRAFEAEFGTADKVSFGDAQRSEVKDERESIIIAEGWWSETVRKKMLVCVDERGDETALSEDDFALAQSRGQLLQVQGEYTDKVRSIKWARMSGAEILSRVGKEAKPTEYPADGIGIVPVYGYVGFANGRMSYCGITRRALMPQRSYNYHMSELHAYMATAPKSPFMASLRAIRGLETLWDRASVDTRAYLPYNDQDEMGPIAAPSRAAVSTNLQNHMAGAERAIQDIQAAIGMYQASLGAPSNETSGVAIDSRKQQGEAATANFPANLAATIAHVGKLAMQMLPRLIDKKRQLRILGIDGSIGKVTLDPAQPEAYAETGGGLVINPNVGAYDVRVIVGAGFSTQRAQAQAAFTEMMRANPAMTPAIAPLWAQTLDVPHADKLAQVLTAVAPPEVKAVLQPQDSGDGPTTAELVAKVEQLSQALQEAIQHAQEAQQDADQAQAEADALKADKGIQEGELALKDRETDIKAYDAETKRIQAQATAEKAAADAEVARKAQELAALNAMHTMDAQDNPPAAPEPVEPAEDKPDPRIDAVIQGQEKLAALITELTKVIRQPRERIPVRDSNGAIQRVIEMLGNEAAPTDQTIQ